ncbi:MAG: hypothetical protein DI535_00515 [Citrobacter freundii]|nr:MAG: hypothetical protein DI535_00515 [Citrobacter freundii]
MCPFLIDPQQRPPPFTDLPEPVRFYIVRMNDQLCKIEARSQPGRNAMIRMFKNDDPRFFFFYCTADL